MYQKYIEKIDKEIKDLIRSESENVTMKGEEVLKLLLKNRKNIKKLAEEKFWHKDKMGMEYKMPLYDRAPIQDIVMQHPVATDISDNPRPY